MTIPFLIISYIRYKFAVLVAFAAWTIFHQEPLLVQVEFWQWLFYVSAIIHALHIHLHFAQVAFVAQPAFS